MESCTFQLKFEKSVPRTFFIFRENGTFNSNINFFIYISENENPERTSYVFSKESFSYSPGNENPEKIPFISGNRTFLYFRKGIFRNLA